MIGMGMFSPLPARFDAYMPFDPEVVYDAVFDLALRGSKFCGHDSDRRLIRFMTKSTANVYGRWLVAEIVPEGRGAARFCFSSRMSASPPPR